MDMDAIYETRRRRLWQEMQDRFEGKRRYANLADLLEVSPDYVSRMFSSKNTKRIGEKYARYFESRLGKPPYWLDGVDLQWPFTSVSFERVRALAPSELREVETVLDTTLTLIEQRHSPGDGQSRRKSSGNAG